MLYYNAQIFTLAGASIQAGWLDTDGPVIRAVGGMAELPSPPADGIDLGGALLLPGFVDAHCHLGMFGDGLSFEGDDGNEATDPVTPQLRAIDAVNPFDRCFSEALAAGITTVLTGPGSTNAIAGEWCAMKTSGSCVDDMLVKAPAGMKFALGENPKNSYSEKNQAPITRMATAALIREQLKKAERYRDDLARAAADPEVALPEYDMKCEALLPLLRRDIPAFFHAHRADDIQTALRIAEEFGLDCVLIHATEGWRIAPQLKKVNAKIIAGPVIADRSKPELAQQTTANAALLYEAGVEAALCTDHPENPIQYLPLCAALAMKAGLPREAALRAITLRAAEIAGIADRVGSLEPGKDADFLVFDVGQDPLNVLSSPRCVIVNGEIVKGAL